MAQETLVILDFGSQYTQLIARRARELNVYSVILPFNASLKKIMEHNPKGVVLSGGPNSVYEKDAPGLANGVMSQNMPVLGLCYGMQLIAYALGGKVEPAEKREYGLSKINVRGKSKLFDEKMNKSTVWMSHGVHVSSPPKTFEVTAKSGDMIAAMENADLKLYGLQFHPETSHSQYGKEMLKNFLVKICGFNQEWSAEEFVNAEIKKIRKLVGKKRVICALSGGVDSSVAATIVHKAIGAQQMCIFVDTGLMQKDDYDEVLGIYKNRGLNIDGVRAENRFLSKLRGVTNPEQKRKIIGREFIKIFEEEAKKFKGAEFLVQGTLYPDVIESVSIHGPSVTIKSHHNVGGLPKKMNLKLIEPLRELFKDEVRRIGGELGLPPKITNRQPFPGPGLGVRVIGKITPKAVEILQEADFIVREEFVKAGANKDLWQYFAVLLPVKTVGVMGDSRTHEKVIAIRAVESSDGMTASYAKLPYSLLGKISSRIISEVQGVNRVVYDITSKPPGTIEWE
ncbi:glutamine-hydrolyzing GMP synthase [Candidatus Parcubacteria bacterium]|nr:glutamine-hydrolyzing GMP synthase [Candidatus Parcubacteria bacterium]